MRDLFGEEVRVFPKVAVNRLRDGVSWILLEEADFGVACRRVERFLRVDDLGVEGLVLLREWWCCLHGERMELLR